MEINNDQVFPNEFAIVYCIGRISLLDMKTSTLKKSPLFKFEIAFHDFWIFLTAKEGDIFL